MSEPIISPDGKSMWTGSEWIPLPPADNDTITPSVEFSDSVMIGDITQVTNDSKAISEGIKKGHNPYLQFTLRINNGSN
jgi:hypothetical protein